MERWPRQLRPGEQGQEEAHVRTPGTRMLQGQKIWEETSDYHIRIQDRALIADLIPEARTEILFSKGRAN